MRLKYDPARPAAHPGFLARILMVAASSRRRDRIRSVANYVERSGRVIVYEAVSGEYHDVDDGRDGYDRVVQIDYALRLDDIVLATWSMFYLNPPGEEDDPDNAVLIGDETPAAVRRIIETLKLQASIAAHLADAAHA